jgi:hypothetical protein
MKYWIRKLRRKVYMYSYHPLNVKYALFMKH